MAILMYKQDFLKSITVCSFFSPLLRYQILPYRSHKWFIEAQHLNLRQAKLIQEGSWIPSSMSLSQGTRKARKNSLQQPEHVDLETIAWFLGKMASENPPRFHPHFQRVLRSRNGVLAMSGPVWGFLRNEESPNWYHLPRERKLCFFFFVVNLVVFIWKKHLIANGCKWRWLLWKLSQESEIH